MGTLVLLITGVAWPALIFYFLWRFENEIRSSLSSVPNLANRLNRAGFVEFQPLAEQQQATELTHEVQQIAAAGFQRDPLVRPFETQLRAQIEGGQIHREADYVDRLIYTAAELARIAQGETTGRQIFGTQIAALRQLANVGPMTTAAITALYDQHLQRVRDAQLTVTPLTFQEWLSFLTGRSLLKIGDDGRYEITGVGRSFLQYLETIGVSEVTRPF